MLTTLMVASVLAVSAQTGYYTDMDQDYADGNSTLDLGEILGGPCEKSCNPDMINVICLTETRRCECLREFPVKLGGNRGCAKPTNIGDQCFYTQTCFYADQNADCIQVRHNAVCQCKQGYHTVTIPRPRKVFCSEDLVVIATDLSTLLGVATGLFVLTALICFVLKLFVGGRPRHYANTNLAPPMLFAQPGMSGVSVLRGGCTRGSRGVLMPSSRAGAARAAAILLISCHLSPSHGNHIRRASVHSSTSSTKSFSARQYERERENRLLAKARNRERDGTTPSPSPRSTENLLDDPLPSDSWPRTDDDGRDSEAFTPDVLENGIGGSMAHIDDPLAMAEDNTEPLPSSPPSYEDSEKQQGNVDPVDQRPQSSSLERSDPTND